MDISKLSDETIAILTYAIESFHDEVRHSDEKYKESFLKRTERYRAKFEEEYSKRKLDYDNFIEKTEEDE